MNPLVLSCRTWPTAITCAARPRLWTTCYTPRLVTSPCALPCSRSPFVTCPSTGQLYFSSAYAITPLPPPPAGSLPSLPQPRAPSCFCRTYHWLFSLRSARMRSRPEVHDALLGSMIAVSRFRSTLAQLSLSKPCNWCGLSVLHGLTGFSGRPLSLFCLKVTLVVLSLLQFSWIWLCMWWTFIVLLFKLFTICFIKTSV